MPAAPWQVEQVPAPAAPATFYEMLGEQIDAEAGAFENPAAFRAAISRILELAQNDKAHELIRSQGEQQLHRIIAALEHFADPAITVDALWALGCMRRSEGHKFSHLARKHRISAQAFHRRVIRVSKFLGVPYRRFKPHHRTNPTT